LDLRVIGTIRGLSAPLLVVRRVLLLPLILYTSTIPHLIVHVVVVVVVSILEVVIILRNVHIAFSCGLELLIDPERGDQFRQREEEHAKENGLAQRVVEDQLLHFSTIAGVKKVHEAFHGRAEPHDDHTARMHACIGDVSDPHVHDLASAVHQTIDICLTDDGPYLPIRKRL